MSKTYVIKRLRKQYTGREDWRPIGTVVVSDDGKTGSVYLNHLDETWRLFEVKKEEEEP
jgi:hypothetical protein